MNASPNLLTLIGFQGPGAAQLARVLIPHGLIFYDCFTFSHLCGISSFSSKLTFWWMPRIVCSVWLRIFFRGIQEVMNAAANVFILENMSYTSKLSFSGMPQLICWLWFSASGFEIHSVMNASANALISEIRFFRRSSVLDERLSWFAELDFQPPV